MAKANTTDTTSNVARPTDTWGIVFDLEDDVRSLVDYSVILNDMLIERHIGKEQLVAASRIASELLQASNRIRAEYYRLFEAAKRQRTSNQIMHV